VTPTSSPQGHLKSTDNAAVVRNYLHAVFVEKSLAKAETFWAGQMIQHNPQMPNGLDVLRQFISNPMPGPGFEQGMVVAQGNLVMSHGRYSGWAGKTLIAVDIFRIEGGKIVEHWDVMQEEVPVDKTANGNPMFTPAA